MNELILSELAVIKWLLLATLAILIVNLLFSIIRSYKNIRLGVELSVRERFISESHRLEDAGKYELLIKLAEMRINSHPDDPNGYWFLAVAKFRSKEWSAALTAFKQIQRIDVSWNKFTVEQYIEDSQSQLKGPEKTIK